MNDTVPTEKPLFHSRLSMAVLAAAARETDTTVRDLLSLLSKNLTAGAPLETIVESMVSYTNLQTVDTYAPKSLTDCQRTVITGFAMILGDLATGRRDVGRWLTAAMFSTFRAEKDDMVTKARMTAMGVTLA